MKAEQLTDPIAHHGEGPVYSPRWGAVRWVDMMVGDVLQLDSSGSVSRHHVAPVAAMVRPRRHSGTVVAGPRGILLSDSDDLDAPWAEGPELWADTDIRMNEGGCDPAGNLYLGSVSYQHRENVARLWRFSAGLEPMVVLDGVTISNGIEWSPDGSLAYYIDSYTKGIDVFDWDPERGLSGRRRLVDTPGEADPDGLTVDADGGVWVAMFDGSSVRRYTSDGRLDQVIDVDASKVTAATFAGPALDQLIITTSRKGLEPGSEPLAGALFTCRPGVHGLPTREYAG